ncbi:MAG: serine/threonine protein kinase [Proteobacteria bacterium]|nr:serine/threonine protein kinase [Pseudomonadota bacterium]MBU4297056.1 serine/threonine protein kinase [Pseudomonadota bacterium]MCG2749937.1 serine/threonine protein kinase [Desulfobulbaceae bacterium]
MKLNQIETGSVIGGFQLEKELGRGGMGVVYKAHELSLNRMVALKILSERLSGDDEFIKRFKREAKVVAALSHPHIVNILSYGEENGLHYFAMEYVKGTDLGQILKEKKSISLEEALPIALQIADALEEAATKGVVHRDLKPSNIMIDSLGRIKITDYGIAYFQDADAKLTQTGLYMGTPEYSSPEQASGAKLDIRSDIYSLGALLYKMVSGEPPVTGESPLAVVAKIITEPIRPIATVNPSLPKPVCELIDKLTAKDINQRFQTPSEVTDAIVSCMGQLHIVLPVTGRIPTSRPLPVPPTPPPVPAEAEKEKGNRTKVLAMAAGIIIAILLSMWTVDALLHRLKQEKSAKETLVPPVQEMTVKEKSSTEQLPAGPATATTSEAPTAPPRQATVDQQEREASSTLAPPPAVVATPPVRTPPVQTTKVEKKAALPTIPVVLTIVSGDETLAPFVQNHIEAALTNSGLHVTSDAEIPVLMEKMQMGSLPISWYDIQRLVPSQSANIVLISQVQQTGSMPLQYYGRSQTLTTVSFTVRAVDMETGAAAGPPASGTAKFTPLNMDEELRKAVNSSVGNMGQSIKEYWQQKLKSGAPRG